MKWSHTCLTDEDGVGGRGGWELDARVLGREGGGGFDEAKRPREGRVRMFSIHEMSHRSL